MSLPVKSTGTFRVEAALNAEIARATAAEGAEATRATIAENALMALFGNGLGARVYSGSWPTRPTEFALVLWIGPDSDPPESLNGDIRVTLS